MPSRIQKKLLIFSGSSVASGARISDRTSGSTPSDSATWIISSTNRWAPPTIAASPTASWSDDQLGRRLVVVAAVHVEAADRLGLLDLAAGAQRRPHVEQVGDEEDDGERDVERLGQHDAGEQPGAEEDQEEDEVAVEGLDVGLQREALLAAPLEDERRRADERHRQRREQERRADDRADRDVLRPLGAADDRDDRDQRLRHRGADRGEDAAGRALAEVEAVAEPLDRVREHERAREDDGEADDEEDGGAHATCYAAKNAIANTA